MPRVDAITDAPAIGGIPRGSTLALSMRGKLGAGTEYGFTDLGKGFYTEADPLAGTYQKRVDGYNQYSRKPAKHRKSYPVLMRDCTPNNPRTPAQQAGRMRFKLAMQMWRALTQSERDEWNEKAAKYSRYGVHLYLKKTLAELKEAET